MAVFLILTVFNRVNEDFKIEVQQRKSDF